MDWRPHGWPKPRVSLSPVGASPPPVMRGDLARAKMDVMATSVSIQAPATFRQSTRRQHKTKMHDHTRGFMGAEAALVLTRDKGLLAL